MPCNSDYLAPTAYECHIKETVKLLCYVYGWVGTRISTKLKHAVEEKTYFTKDSGDKWVSRLYAVLESMSKEVGDKLV